MIDVEGLYKIRYYENNTDRFKEWVIPILIIKDLIKWVLKKRKRGVKSANEETKICKFILTECFVDIKRKDIYTNVGYTLPIEILNYLIENKGKY